MCSKLNLSIHQVFQLMENARAKSKFFTKEAEYIESQIKLNKKIGYSYAGASQELKAIRQKARDYYFLAEFIGRNAKPTG